MEAYDLLAALLAWPATRMYRPPTAIPAAPPSAAKASPQRIHSADLDGFEPPGLLMLRCNLKMANKAWIHTQQDLMEQ